MFVATATKTRRVRPKGLTIGASALGFVLLLVPAVSISDGQGPSPDDPLPLQRVAIPLSRLPAEMERVRQGALIQMPRHEFEAMVQRAARAGHSAQGAARLIKAKYSAEFIDNALVHGSGQWTVHRPGSGPAVLPVSSLNLALNKPHWAGGEDAILGDLEGKNLGLFVSKAGEFHFDWSLRGNALAEGIQFHLHLPQCPAATLDLTVPADHQVLVPKKTVLLSGPRNSAQPGKQIWHLEFTGRSQVEFQVRRAADAQQMAPLFLSQLQTKQMVTPNRLAADFEFQVEVLHTAVRELVFDCDPSLQPFDVSIDNADLKDWEFKEAPFSQELPKVKGMPAAKPAILVLHLREPFQGSLQGVKIRCLAPRPAGKLWTSPALRLCQAQLRGESLKVSIHSDVQMESWDPAGFRLVSSTTNNDGTQVLSLIDPAAGLEPSRRPVCQFKSRGFALLIRQQNWWHIGPTGSLLAADISYELVRGSLFQLALKLPVPSTLWRVEAVQLEPKDALRSWVTTGPLLLVDLQRGLNPRNPVLLSVRMALRPEAMASGPQTLDIPVLHPLDSSIAHGTVAITVDPLFQVALKQVAAPMAVPPKEGPWLALGALPPQYFFEYRGKPIMGQLRLYPQKARVRVRCQEEVVLTQGPGSLQARLDLEPMIGNPTAMDLVVTVPRDASLTWKVEGASGFIRALERRTLSEALPYLMLLGPAPFLHRPLLEVQLPPVQHWRLQFTKPLTRRETIVLHATLESRRSILASVLPILLSTNLIPPLPTLLTVSGCSQGPFSSWEHWDIPLLVIPDADRQEAEITLQPVGVELVHVEALGLEQVAVPGGAQEMPRDDVWRVFRLSPTFHGNLAHLRVATQVHQVTASAGGWCDQAQLVTYVETGAPLLHHFRFHSWNWHKRELVIIMPGKVKKVLAAKMDGHWLEYLAQEETENGRQITLPAATDQEGHRFELYYLTEATWSSWPTWTDLEVPLPQLPVASLSVRRSWRLAPGLVPLHQERLQPLSDLAGFTHDLRGVWHVGDPILADLFPVFGEEPFELQREVMLGAESGLRRKLTRDMTLGEALDRLAHEFLKGQLPLVVDRGALRAADLRPDASLAPAFGEPGGATRPFWEYLGLVYVPFPSGPVLTTRAQLEAWRRIYGGDTQMRTVCDPAVTEAIAREHDLRGRFVTLGHWLRTEKKADPPALFLPRGEGWTIWEPRPDQAQPARLQVFQTASRRSLSIFLGLLSLGMAWRIGRMLSWAWCFRLCVIWLAALGLALICLSAALRPILWWPLVAASACSVCWLARFLRVVSAAPTLSNKSMQMAKVLVGGASLWLLLIPGSWVPHARSDGSEPYTVLLVESEPGKPLALVSQDLVKKLGELESRGATPSAAVLLGARYQGKLKGNLAAFTVEFAIHNFSEKATLSLPLTGVELQEGSFLDGSPVFPIASPGPKPGYLVDVERKGRHRLVLAFTVRLAPTGDHQELRFSCPPLCTNLLEWSVDGAAQALQLVTSQGEEKLHQVSPNTYELNANLGPESTVHLRWRLQNAPVAATAVEVREAYYWDLRPGAVSLSAAFQYAPFKGTLSHLALIFPEEMEVRALDAISGSPATAAPPLSLVKKWYIAGKGAERQLHVDLTGPVAQPVLLSLNLVPRINLAAGNIMLKLPLPLAAKQTASFLAYRLEGLEAVDKAQNLGVTAISPEVFGKVWTSSGQKDPGPLSRAYSFRRTAGHAGLELALTVPMPRVKGEVVWSIYPSHADFAATLQIAGAGEEFSLVEVNLPAGIVLADVRGAALHHWSRQKTGAQIWLKQPRKLAVLEISGWAPLVQQPTAAKAGRFLLPPLHIANVRLDSFQVKVLPSQGVSVETERLHNLVKGTEPYTFIAASPVYKGTFQVRTLAARADVQILTTAAVRENACILVSHFHCQAPLGNPGPMQVLLQNCPCDDVRLEFPGIALRAGHRRLGADHLWELTFPPGAPQPIKFQLWARIALEELTKWSMPDVTVQGVQKVNRWLAVTGPELRPEVFTGLVKVQAIAKDLRLWPGEAQRIQNEGDAWHIKEPKWSLNLEVRSSGRSPPVKILLSQEQAFLADGKHWAHQADFLVAVRGDTDLQLALPAEARLVELTVDDQPLQPRPAGPDTYWVPLTGQPGPRTLRLRWRFLPEGESLEHPHLGGAYLRGVPASPRQGRVIVPFGYGVSSMPEGNESSLMQQLLARAQAQLALCHFLAKPFSTTVTSALLGAHKTFRWNMRQAELQMSYVAGDNKKPMYAAALAELRTENERLLNEKGFEEVRNQAEKYPADMLASAHLLFAVPEQGRPVFWQLPDARQGVAISLVSDAGRQWRTAQGWSALLVLAAGALILLSYWTRGLGYLAALWPELCLLLALVGTLVWGFSLPGAILAALGAVGRFYGAVRVLRRFVTNSLRKLQPD